MENERKDIRTLAKKYEKLQTLMNYINKETLMQQFGNESSNKASGIDQVTKDEYGANLEANIEELLKNIYDDKVEIERQKEETSKNLAQVELLRKSLEKENISKKDKELETLNKAKLEAQNILLSAKDDANYTIKELERILNKWKALDELDIENLSDSEIANIVRDLKKASIGNANAYRNKLNSSLNSIYSNNQEESSSKINKSDLSVGMNIRLKTISDIATITSLSGKSNQLQVQVGSVKMNANINDIISIENNVNKTHSTSSYSSIAKSRTVNTEINVIGQNVDEACFVIDKYLDDCALAKLKTVRIVHGKGTGKLREGIHSFLRKHPHVKSFRLGTFGEGEMGVTVVELKS